MTLNPVISTLGRKLRLAVIGGGPGSFIGAMHRQAATHVAKILKGTKVGDIPIEQPNRFEFVVNLKTAKAIGLDLPTSILVRADNVIE